MLGEAVQNVKNVLANVVATVDRYRIGDHRALITRQCRVRQRADEQPGEEANVIDAFDELFGALLSIGRQIAEPGQVFDDGARVAILALVQLGELESEKLGEARFQIGAQRIFAGQRLQIFVRSQALLHFSDRVNVSYEGDYFGYVLFQTVGRICLYLKGK